MTEELLKKIKEIETKIGKNWLEEFQKTETAQDIMKVAKKHDVLIDEILAQEAVELLKEDELSDEQLRDISGGGLLYKPGGIK